MNYKLKITGMSCKSCEQKVEKKLLDLDYIVYARAYSINDYVIVESKKRIKPYQINKVLMNTDYVCEKVEQYRSSTMDKLSNFLMVAVVVTLLVVGRRFVPTLSTTEGVYIGLSIVFVYGILNAFHCMSMCGGLIVTRIMILNKGNAKREIMLYTLGRLISYTSIGALLGAIGSVISINETFKGFVSVFAGVLMVLLALQLFGLVRLPKLTKQFKYKPDSSFGLGIMNGFLPCGSLQAMQLYALSSGSLLLGASVMFVFGLTTSLSLITIAGLTNRIRLQSKKIKILSVVIIMFLGLQFFIQGISQIRVSSSNDIQLVVLDETEEYQSLIVDVTSTYKFSKDQIKVGIPVKIEFGIIDPDGCANPFYIISPSGRKVKVDVLKDSSPITFIPEETGELWIVCWMNMRTRGIDVIE